MIPSLPYHIPYSLPYHILLAHIQLWMDGFNTRSRLQFLSTYLPRKVQPHHFTLVPLNVIAARCVRWIPMGDAQEDALRSVWLAQCVRAEQPIACARLDAGRLHMAWPIAHIEVEASVQQWTSRRRNELDEHVLRSAFIRKYIQVERGDGWSGRNHIQFSRNTHKHHQYGMQFQLPNAYPSPPYSSFHPTLYIYTYIYCTHQ